MSHTAGPWRIGYRDETDLEALGFDPITIVEDRDTFAPTVICETSALNVAGSKSASDKHAIAVANARLIAAAPDMLVALEDIALGWGRFSQDPLTHASNCIEDMKEVARAAIAKATQSEEATP